MSRALASRPQLHLSRVICVKMARCAACSLPVVGLLSQGKFEFVNGDIYAGEWVNNRRNGRGRCEYHTGEIYDGEWRDDVRAGAGDETIPRDEAGGTEKQLNSTAALSGTLRVWPEPARPRVPEAA